MVTSLSPMSVREARGDVSRKSRACIQYYVSCTKTPRSTYTSVSRNASLTAAELHGQRARSPFTSDVVASNLHPRRSRDPGCERAPPGGVGDWGRASGALSGRVRAEGGVPLTTRPANQCRRPYPPPTKRLLYYPIPPSPLSTDHARDSTITAAVLILDVAARPL